MCASVQVCKCASVQVCKCASVQVQVTRVMCHVLMITSEFQLIKLYILYAADTGTIMRSKEAHGPPHGICRTTWRCAESQHPLLPLKKQP